jgi:DNA adenine methylase
MKPFRLFAWVGSKQKMMPQLLRMVPPADSFGAYHEPFCGSASLFFNLNLENKQVFLNDANPAITNVFRQARSHPYEFKVALEMIQNRFNAEINARFERSEIDLDGKKQLAKQFYYAALERYDAIKERLATPDGGAGGGAAEGLDVVQIEGAALFVYLMSLTYGAIYLENAAGNVVPGYGPRTRVTERQWTGFSRTGVDRAISTLQANEVRLTTGDYVDAVLESAQPNDFVFLDPPYHGTRVTRYVGRYEFGEADQQRLYDTFVRLSERGVKIMMTNMNTEAVRTQYSSYRQVPLSTRRDLAREGTGAHEIAILNF